MTTQSNDRWATVARDALAAWVVAATMLATLAMVSVLQETPGANANAVADYQTTATVAMDMDG